MQLQTGCEDVLPQRIKMFWKDHENVLDSRFKRGGFLVGFLSLLLLFLVLLLVWGFLLTLHRGHVTYQKVIKFT